MTRLANPAAVARFADDNVAHFPNGGGRLIKSALSMKIVNNLSSIESISSIVMTGFIITNGAVDQLISLTEEEAAIAPNSSKTFVFPLNYNRNDESYDYCYLPSEYELSEVINLNSIPFQDGVIFAPLDNNKDASCTIVLAEE